MILFYVWREAGQRLLFAWVMAAILKCVQWSE